MSAQRSYYANVKSKISGLVYDFDVGDTVEFEGPLHDDTVYSPYYDSLEDCKEFAVVAFNGLYVSVDATGNIPVYHEETRLMTLMEPDPL